MALPQKVVDRLAWEKPKTPGWSGHMLIFTFTLFFLTLFVYLGLRFGLIPYLESEVADLGQRIEGLRSQISTEDQRGLSDFYSRLVNVKTLLGKHVYASPIFAWVEQNIEGNVFLSRFALSVPNQTVTIDMSARSFNDMIQQIRHFETHPDITKVVIASVGEVKKEQGGGAFATSSVREEGSWSFSATLTLKPQQFFREQPPPTP